LFNCDVTIKNIETCFMSELLVKQIMGDIDQKIMM
jgi:hypothetical protein